MFQGESNISIDDKGRMAIPTAWRDTLAAVCGNRLMLTYNPFDPGCLWLFPHEEWRRARDQVAALHSFNTTHRQLRRALIGSAAELAPDSHHRVLLPASLRQTAGIGKRAVLIGLGDKFELWAEDAHQERMATTIAAEDITAEMLELRI